MFEKLFWLHAFLKSFFMFFNFENDYIAVVIVTSRIKNIVQDANISDNLLQCYC